MSEDTVSSATGQTSHGPKDTAGDRWWTAMHARKVDALRRAGWERWAAIDEADRWIASMAAPAKPEMKRQD